MANSDKKIIYIDDDGNVAIMTPADKTELSVEEIQAKDVPAGKTSYIINATDVPTYKSFRDAWTYTP